MVLPRPVLGSQVTIQGAQRATHATLVFPIHAIASDDLCGQVVKARAQYTQQNRGNDVGQVRLMYTLA